MTFVNQKTSRTSKISCSQHAGHSKSIRRKEDKAQRSTLEEGGNGHLFVPLPVLVAQLSDSTRRDRHTAFRHILTGNTELVKFLVPLIK